MLMRRRPVGDQLGHRDVGVRAVGLLRCYRVVVKGDHCYLIDVVRERFNYPDLKRAALELRTRYPDAVTLIEEKGSGISLIQDLRAEQVSVIGIKPETDKVDQALCLCAALRKWFSVLPGVRSRMLLG